MTKIYTSTEEIEHCGECANCCCYEGGRNPLHACTEKGENIKDVWGEIPKWCELPDTDHP